MFNKLIHLLCYIKGVIVGKNVKFNGFPVIRKYPGSHILIGDNCEFNSSPHSIIIKLSKRCTFITARKDAKIVFGNKSGASGLVIVAAESVRIGNNVLIGAHSTIIDNDFHNTDPSKRYIVDNYIARPVVIEDNVYIGFNCTILKGVIIGENSVIGANSVVIQNIPRNSIAIGNPCRVIIKKDWESSGNKAF
ncbi:MAG: acyltransferase [Bacteroidales bacterium]|jgi:acetyltransferase-like isoleucine patch superfamily enzyme|nr:acyltransferase [Bacteroidales bacterium]